MRLLSIVLISSFIFTYSPVSHAQGCDNIIGDLLKLISLGVETLIRETICNVLIDGINAKNSLPDLTVPTPFMTPTPEAIPGFIPPGMDILDSLATVEYNANYLPTQMAVQNNQVYFGNKPLLPNNQDTYTVISYSKWLTTSASYSLTGPLSPIVIHLGIFLLLSLAFIVIYFLRIIITTIFKFVWWLIQLILKFIPFIG